MKHIILLFAFISTVFASPTWVESLRTGEVALQIEQNGQYFFRYLKKDAKLSESELCELSVEENIENIKRAYPSHINLAMKVQLIHYDKQHKDCATTIVIDKEAIDNPKPMLDKQTRLLIKLAKNRQKSTLQKLRSGVYVGMNIPELRVLFDRKFTHLDFKGTVTCYKHYKSPAAYVIQGHTICWSSFELEATVLGVCINQKVCIENKL